MDKQCSTCVHFNRAEFIDGEQGLRAYRCLFPMPFFVQQSYVFPYAGKECLAHIEVPRV